MSYDSLLNQLFDEASGCIPGGVDSPARSFNYADIPPILMKKGEGAYIWDEEDHCYLDFCMSWGPLILGHAHPRIIAEVKKTIEQGTSFGCPTQLETQLAELVIDASPSIEKVRFVNSGTEATMSAIRLARGYSGKDKIIKFDGCYHGHADHLLVQAGSGVENITASSSKGIPENIISNTFSLPYNDIEQFERVLEEHHEEIACVIMEPVPANMGLIQPQAGYLEKIRELTRKYGVILIFDEVISGFRLAYGGAQEYYNVIPDLTCLGKIIGGGMPVGAFGGKSEIMNHLAPLGGVYQAGTLSGNPVAMRAGIETLSILKEESVYSDLEEKSKYLEEQLKGVSFFNRLGSIFSFNLSNIEHPANFREIKQNDPDKFKEIQHHCLKNGIYISPSPFEVNFISWAHTKKDLDRFIEQIKTVS